MSDSVTIEVKGLKELSQAMQQLPQKLKGKVLGASVKAGAELIRNQARANAPVLTGAVKGSIVAYPRRGNRPDDITYEVGVTMKKKWPKSVRRAASGVMGRTGKSWSAFWWRFQEFGTIKHAAKPFLRPAFDYRSGESLALIKLMLARAIPIAVAALPKYTGG